MDKTLHLLLRVAIAFLAGAAALCAAAEPEQAQLPLVEQVQHFVAAQVARPALSRIEIVPGRFDDRLRLAPCDQVQTYLPGGMRLWGKTRVGLRCVKGARHWNVYLPVTVNVYVRALVSSLELPAGHVLSAEDFHQAEVNMAEDLINPPVTDGTGLLGRALAKPVGSGQALRQNSLRARQWFAAGDQVQIRVAGSGFAVGGAGEAITAGTEGQPARVRTESGRVVSGMPVGARQLEIAL